MTSSIKSPTCPPSSSKSSRWCLPLVTSRNSLTSCVCPSGRFQKERRGNGPVSKLCQTLKSSQVTFVEHQRSEKTESDLIRFPLQAATCPATPKPSSSTSTTSLGLQCRGDFNFIIIYMSIMEFKMFLFCKYLCVVCYYYII